MHRLKSVSEQLPDESEHKPGREMGVLVGFAVTGESEGPFDGFEVGTSVTGDLLGVLVGLFVGYKDGS